MKKYTKPKLEQILMIGQDIVTLSDNLVNDVTESDVSWKAFGASE